ncbi:hypothetical protein SAMN05421736_12362 [Evansella caseinilytica]|uniref:Tetratricopeptide repeat protein n=1 Tax=Evansella caseinilytica TaxID=1503961 RepID=A0A1H3UND4_9BACI|nr:AimR family lysis-lysogeny pheromone receptor [Evansella caseinilytica]SDZ63561.1 hypothetical protein SAMN05421736_12362 [Evansella caseinilytica]
MPVNRNINENSDGIFRSLGNIDHVVKELDPTSYLARVSLEYAVSHSKRDLLDYLIERLLLSGNEESREWAEIYQLDNMVYKGEISLVDSIHKLTYIHCASTEMSILRKIFQLYNYYDLKAFQMIEILSGLIDNEINLLENSYMKDSFQSRLNLAMQSVHIHLNRLEESRKYGLQLKAIASTPIMKAIAYKNIALSYMFEDYEKSIAYFYNSLTILKKLQNHNESNNVQRIMNFVHSYWEHPEKTEWIRKETIDEIHTYVFSLIKKGDKELAIKVLDEAKNKIENDFQQGYHNYFRGLITDEEKYYYESVKFFSKSGDQFFRQLPLTALKEKGVDTMLLSALSV